jgi:hypothetical protein
MALVKYSVKTGVKSPYCAVPSWGRKEQEGGKPAEGFCLHPSICGRKLEVTDL